MSLLWGHLSSNYLKVLFQQVKSLEMSQSIWWAPNADRIIRNINGFQWACDDCFRDRKAIIAHPERQTFFDHPPFLAYFNNERVCSTCKQFFIFWAKEQLFWYEGLKFWVQSEAKNCLPCRKKVREQKNKNI